MHTNILVIYIVWIFIERETGAIYISCRYLSQGLFFLILYIYFFYQDVGFRNFRPGFLNKSNSYLLAFTLRMMFTKTKRNRLYKKPKTHRILVVNVDVFIGITSTFLVKMFVTTQSFGKKIPRVYLKIEFYVNVTCSIYKKNQHFDSQV